MLKNLSFFPIKEIFLQFVNDYFNLMGYSESVNNIVGLSIYYNSF